MTKGRLEAFSDGVIAIIITIMVLELKVPHGEDLAALRPLIPIFISYVLSFVFIGIYWTNHHHLLHEQHWSLEPLGGGHFILRDRCGTEMPMRPPMIGIALPQLPLAS